MIFLTPELRGRLHDLWANRDVRKHGRSLCCMGPEEADVQRGPLSHVPYVSGKGRTNSRVSESVKLNSSYA